MSTYGEAVRLRLTPDIHDELRAEAEATERNVSQVIRLAIRQYLAQPRETIRAN